MITRSDIAAHLERSVRTGFLVGGKDYRPLRSLFVREVPSDGAFESYADMGMLPWPIQNAGSMGPGGSDSRTGGTVVNRLSGGRQITIIGGQEKSMIVYNVDWEIAIGIEHNAIDDDKVGDIESWARGAAVNFEKHKDYLAFNALNVGEGTTYGAAYDGLSFFNDAHVDPSAQYTTVQDNKNALALSLDNFQIVKVAASKFLDDRGQPVGFNHNLLIIPPDLEYAAAQITMNREAYDTANREINPYAGSVRSIVAPGGWLDSTAWFLLDVSQPQKPLHLQIRKQPSLTIWDIEENGGGGTRYYKWHSRYSVFYGDWRLAIEGNT